MPYLLSPAADDDAFELDRAAERFNSRHGRMLNAELDDLLERIGENPGIGAFKPAITPHPYRFKLFRDQWWVIYKDAPKGHMVEIVRILWVHDDLVNALLD